MSGAIWDVILFVLGVILGWVANWWVTRHYTHRGKLVIELSPSFSLSPRELGALGQPLTIRYANVAVEKLICFELRVQNTGDADLLLEIPVPHQPTDPPMPRIDFARFRVLAFATLDPDEARFNIALAKCKNDTAVYLNIRRIKAHARATFGIVGAPDEGVTEAEVVKGCFPGFIPNTDIQLAGFLSGAVLRG